MGTQQLLLIVLSVIIIGVAIAVGITMFGSQSASSNRNAVIADLHEFGMRAITFWKTPASMAGGGNGNPGFGSSVALRRATVGMWIGFKGGAYLWDYNENGSYVLLNVSTSNSLLIWGMGNQKGQDPNCSNWGGRIGYVQVNMTVEPTADNPITIVTIN